MDGVMSRRVITRKLLSLDIIAYLLLLLLLLLLQFTQLPSSKSNFTFCFGMRNNFISIILLALIPLWVLTCLLLLDYLSSMLGYIHLFSSNLLTVVRSICHESIRVFTIIIGISICIWCAVVITTHNTILLLACFLVVCVIGAVAVTAALTIAVSILKPSILFV